MKFIKIKSNVFIDVLIYKLLENNDYDWNDLRRRIIKQKKIEYIYNNINDNKQQLLNKSYKESEKERKMDIKKNNQDYYRYIFFDNNVPESFWNTYNKNFVNNLSIGVLFEDKEIVLNQNIKKLDLHHIHTLKNIKLINNNNNNIFKLKELNLALSNMFNDNMNNLYVENLKIILDINNYFALYKNFDENLNLLSNHKYKNIYKDDIFCSVLYKKHFPIFVKNLILDNSGAFNDCLNIYYLPKNLNRLIILNISSFYYKGIEINPKNIKKYFYWIPYIEWNFYSNNLIWFNNKKYDISSFVNKSSDIMLCKDNKWSLWLWLMQNSQLFLEEEFCKIPFKKELMKKIYGPDNLHKCLNKYPELEVCDVLDLYGLS